jgi:hypothetical protein
MDKLNRFLERFISLPISGTVKSNRHTIYVLLKTAIIIKHQSIQNILSSRVLVKNLKHKIYNRMLRRESEHKAKKVTGG